MATNALGTRMLAVSTLAATMGFMAAQAQTPDTVEAHVAAATAAAGAEFKAPLRLCNPPGQGGGIEAARAEPEPAKIFDNLYFIGVNSVSAWAITTSSGIIVIDSLNNPREAETYIEGGLRKLGLDPMQVKYVIVTHAHGDHFGGAQYLADRLQATLVMSDTDWNVLANAQPPANPNPNRGPIPRRGMGVKDGDHLTLGDTTVEIYQTPPHTPGAISLIFPVKDGSMTHTAALWGGIGFNFPQTEQNYTTYADSVRKFATAATDKGADVPLANHSNFDEALEKIAKLKSRMPGQPNPFVLGEAAEQRMLTTQAECALAQRARLRAAK